MSATTDNCTRLANWLLFFGSTIKSHDKHDYNEPRVRFLLTPCLFDVVTNCTIHKRLHTRSHPEDKRP